MTAADERLADLAFELVEKVEPIMMREGLEPGLTLVALTDALALYAGAAIVAGTLPAAHAELMVQRLRRMVPEAIKVARAGEQDKTH